MNDILANYGLGTAQLSGGYGAFGNGSEICDRELEAMLDLAQKSGIATIDTAEAYGEAESRLGMFDLSQFNLVTKIRTADLFKKFRNPCFQRTIEQSLTRLKTDKVQTILLHDAAYLNANQIFDALKQLQKIRDLALCQKIGVSLYDPSQIFEIAHGNNVDVIQIPASAIDQRILHGDIISFCKKKNIEIHTRSVFLQGALLNSKKLPRHLTKWRTIFEAWETWLERKMLSPLEGALSVANFFVTAGVSKIIVGATSLEELEAIISAAMTEPRAPCNNIKCDDHQLIHPFNW